MQTGRTLGCLFFLTILFFVGRVESLTSDESNLELLEKADFYIYVDKKANLLSVRSLDYPAREIKSYRAISGLNAGDKVSEGDRKTPEGIYFVDAHVPPSMIVRSLHGAAGFSLDYPNRVDRINSQTGSGIWIHGVDTEERLERRFDTRGCVAMGNTEVVELKKWVRPKKTPVVIVDESSDRSPMGLVSPTAAAGRRTMEWAQAWSSQDTDAYLEFYHPDFYSRNMNYNQWRTYKNSLNNRYEYIKVEISNLRVFRHSKYWVTVFDQSYESNMYRSRGPKRLYWVGPEDNLRIIAEESL
jgi:murein L,D-transpeptidase YafK